jgi:hypothetical protein
MNATEHLRAVIESEKWIMTTEHGMSANFALL